MGAGASPLWIHRSPRRMGAGASFVLQPPRPPPHGRGGLLCFGFIEAPVTGAWGPLFFLDHRVLHRAGGGTYFTFGSSRPSSRGHGGFLCFGTTKAPLHWRGGLLSRVDHRCPRRMGARTSFIFGTPRSLPHGRGGLLRVWIIKAPVAWVGGPLPGVMPRCGSHTTVQGLATCTLVAGAQARSPCECRGWQLAHRGNDPCMLELRYVPGGKVAWGECVLVCARTPPARVLCGGGGD